MDSFELNKIIGAVLGTLLFIMGVGFLAEAIYEPKQGLGAGYALPEPEGTEHTTGEPVEAVPISVLLASANAEQGASAARKCQGCHNFGDGEANKQGPGLYDVVGRVIGSHEGFAYSPAMAEHQAAGDTWTYENLDHFLLAPKNFAPGTKMNFGGLRNDAERANVIAFLSTLSGSPLPFPTPEAAPAAEASAEIAPDTAVDTPTVTADETVVEGTPTTSAPASAEPAPAEGAAPAN